MPADLPTTIQNGLPRTIVPKRVVVVGAGMAGLVAACELRRAGHQVVVLEATQRVGGRVQTLREPFSPGLYAEAGAMRVPRSHRLTLSYIEKFGLPVRQVAGAYANDLVYFNGRRLRIGEISGQAEVLGFDAAAARHDETGQLILHRWSQIVAEAAAHADDDTYWQRLEEQHGDRSLRQFLAQDGWSEEAIVAFGLLTSYEVILGAAFVDSLRSDVALHDADLMQIPGGMDQLPRAFLPELRGCIRFGAELVALDQSPDGVTVHFRTGAGVLAAEAEYAIVTVPFPALRFVDVRKPFSTGKQRAIRQLHYMDSTKILLQCRRRFWEEDEGIFGSSTATDLPIRLLYYPEHGRETGRGVLLASYTWGEDAERWGSLPPSQRIVEAVRQVACIHPQIAEEFEVGTSKIWHEDRFAGGAFAFFEPGQERHLHPHIVAPEGRIHFAGEHTSLKHAWIEGAVESGLRAALEVHGAA